MTTSIFFTNEQDLQAAVEQEAAELKAIEESLIERAYSGKSLYKLATAEVKLLILLV